MQKRSLKSKVIISLLLVLFVLNTTMLTLAFPRSAKAGMPVTVDANLPGTAEVIKETIWDLLLKALTVGGMQAVSSVLQMWTQQLAYDIATSLATAEWGKSPAFFTQDWGNYMKSLGEQGLGEFIGSISKNWGINFCEPALPEVKLKLIFGLESKYRPKEPRCNWSKIKGNWKDVAGQIKDMAQGDPNVWRKFLRQNLQARWNPSENDMGVFLEASWMGRKMIKEKEEAGKAERESSSWKAIKEYISKDIKTPADMTKKEMEKAFEASQKMTDSQIAAAYNAAMIKPEALLQVFTSTLVNTFVSKFSERVFKGFFDWMDSLGGDSSGIADGGLKYTSSSPKAIKASFKDFLIPPVQSVTDYNILGEFRTCPDEIARGVNHCVIDPQFAAGIEQAGSKNPLTLQEAVDQGLIDGNKKFVDFENSLQKNKTECWSGQWLCYPNLVKLRKARIIPIGWELLAEKSGSGRVTLKQAMEGFSQAG